MKAIFDPLVSASLTAKSDALLFVFCFFFVFGRGQKEGGKRLWHEPLSLSVISDVTKGRIPFIVLCAHFLRGGASERTVRKNW